MVSSTAGSGSVVRAEARPVGAAGIVSRTAANVIDFVVISSLLAGVYLFYATLRFLLRPRAFTFPAPSLLFVIIAGGVLASVYFTVCWAATGRTYGALVLGLRVVSGGRNHLRLSVAILRAAACVVFPIGLVWSGIDRRRRSVQDVVLRTTVVYDWPGTR